MSNDTNTGAAAPQDEPIGYLCRHSAQEKWFFSDTPGYWEHKPVYGRAALPAQAVAPAEQFIGQVAGWVDDGGIVFWNDRAPADGTNLYLAAHPCALAAPVQDVAPSEARAVPSSNDGKEQDAFEEWAKGERMDMTTHPLHWLFLDAKTYAARQGWKGALEYVGRVLAAAPAAPQAVQNPIPQRLRDAFSRIEDSSPAASGMQVFTQMRTAAQAYFQSLNAAQPAAQPADAQDYKQARFEAWYLDSNDVPKEAVSRAEPGQHRGMYAWIGTDEAWDIWTAAIDAARTQEGAAS